MSSITREWNKIWHSVINSHVCKFSKPLLSEAHFKYCFFKWSAMKNKYKKTKQQKNNFFYPSCKFKQLSRKTNQNNKIDIIFAWTKVQSGRTRCTIKLCWVKFYSSLYSGASPKNSLLFGIVKFYFCILQQVPLVQVVKQICQIWQHNVNDVIPFVFHLFFVEVAQFFLFFSSHALLVTWRKRLQLHKY